MVARVRFAPSPTGYLHLGGLRTALYNYLFARKHVDGKFLLRIDDTDRSRYVPGAEEALVRTLGLFGIQSDEPLIRQSERLSLYEGYAKKLVDNDGAYPCFCSEERLESMKQRGSTVYDRRCRSIGHMEAKERMASGESHTIRLKAPVVGSIDFMDMIRGQISLPNNMMNDQILLKSDGFPTYHLATVVDDHKMNISHVIRGEEWVSSTTKHILLHQLLDMKVPEYAHLPLLLNKDRSKVSKRNQDMNVEFLLNERGYDPMAILNFVALLGWSPKNNVQYPNGLDDADLEEEEDEEEEAKMKSLFFSMDDLTQAFDLAHGTKRSVVMDMEYLHWISGQHVRNMSMARLMQELRDRVPESNSVDDDRYLEQVLQLILTRVFAVREIPDYASHFFLQEDIPYSDEDETKLKPDYPSILTQVHDQLKPLEKWEIKSMRKAFKKVQSSNKVPMSDILLPIRWATTGSLKGAALPETLELLGRERTMARVSKKAR